MNCVLFSSWTVNWPPLIFSVIRELSFIFFVNRELESFIFPVIRDWPLFFFREPWILPIIFVNFPIFPHKIHMSFIVMIRNWFLVIDIGLLFSEMWRRLVTISYMYLKLKSWHNACTSDFKRDYTRVFPRADLGGGGDRRSPPFFNVVPPPFFLNFNTHTILILSNYLFFTML